jgi:hypothetical protein
MEQPVSVDLDLVVDMFMLDESPHFLDVGLLGPEHVLCVTFGSSELRLFQGLLLQPEQPFDHNRLAGLLTSHMKSITCNF